MGKEKKRCQGSGGMIDPKERPGSLLQAMTMERKAEIESARRKLTQKTTFVQSAQPLRGRRGEPKHGQNDIHFLT